MEQATSSQTKLKKRLRVVIADAQALFRAGLRRLLENSRIGIEVVGEATDGSEAIRQVLELRPDILVFDLLLPELDGLEVLRRIQPIQGVRKVLLTKKIDQDDLRKATTLGVSNVVLKQSSIAELLECIRRPDNIDAPSTISPGTTTIRSSVSPRHRGQQRFRITEREMEVLKTLVAGRTNPEIAERLLISTETVKHHITNLFNKTGASNRVELVLFATKKGLVDRSRFGIE